MAVRKSKNFLPNIFQTDTNEKFLSATMDQLVSEPVLTNLYGYIGRKFSPTFKPNDSYIIESSVDRQNFQLESGVVVKDDSNNVNFFSSYPDFLNKIKYYGGLTNDHSRLFAGEYYSFDPKISYDKIVNFSQYYWLPNGPDAVEVSTNGVDLIRTYTVSRDTATGKYVFSSNGVVDYSIILPRGGTYKFIVNQPGIPFWIQTELGIDGRLNATSTISSRDVFGVENNGIDQGVITFNIPQRTAQERFTLMQTVASVDYAAPLAYSDLHNRTLSWFRTNFPEYVGITGQLDGKQLVFIEQDQLSNRGDEIWTNPNVIYSSHTAFVVNKSAYGNIGTNKLTIDSVTDVYANLIVSGTGIADGTTVTNIDVGNLTVTLSSNLTANATGTYSFISSEFNSTGTNKLKLDSVDKVYDNLIVSGTGIADGTTVTDIDVGNLTVTLSSNLTANTTGIYSFTSAGYEAGTIVDESKRYGVWRVQFININIDDPLIRLVWVQDVIVNQKVYIRYGVTNANKEFYKDFDGFFHQTPLLSSLQDTIVAQDGADPDIYSIFKIVEYTNWTIDVTTDIVGQLNYTSPNGVQFTSGLKIEFGTDVVPAEYQNKQYYVEGVGDTTDGIALVLVDDLVTPEKYIDENLLNYPDDIFPEYTTINRSSRDQNAWARNNRWFHRDVIQATADYRNEVAVFDQAGRAKRPIIQFEAGLQLFNEGRIAKKPVDIIDFTTTNAFFDYEGRVYDFAFGVNLVDDMRIIFINDIDTLVKNKIYRLTKIQTELDSLGNPTGTEYIKLVKEPDGDVLPYDTVVVKQGQYKGTQWWFDGSDWKQSQQKTSVQQEPLYDVFDSGFDSTQKQITQGRSFSTYVRSSFTGTTIFGYTKSSTGVTDPVLGFPLSYRNFSTQGDIEFTNFFDTDTFTYVDDRNVTRTIPVNQGFMQKVIDRYTLVPQNTWITVVEPSKQYQNIGYVYDGTSNVFPVDITPETETSIPYVKVYKNFKYLPKDQWILVGGQVRLTQSEKFISDGVTARYTLSNITSVEPGIIVLVNNVPKRAFSIYTISGLSVIFSTIPNQGDIIDIRVIDSPAIGDKIDILIYSSQTSQLGFYQPPQNLDSNAQNFNNNSLTLGQLRNHLVAIGQNSNILQGDVLGISNLRDVDIKQQGGTILQHASPIPYGELFLLDSQANFVDSVRYAQREYSKFKNKFLELGATLPGIQPTNPAASVDLILAEINKIKNTTFPWLYSDMIPYGTLKNSYDYTVFDPLRTNYELTKIFNNVVLSNQAVLIYLNGNQLINEVDYVFLLDRPAVQFIRELEVEDIITIVEYLDTDGSYVPETPTKLGLWPKYVPTIFFDTSYRKPTNVIRGHDGSITPAFGDYRDDFLLELELRIYNNLKLSNENVYSQLLDIIPGKFRSADYTLSEVNQIISTQFQSWIGNNRLDFAENSQFQSNDAFTWNYGATRDRIDGETLPGSWRACYKYFYDTVHPHLFPWEMLGFSIKPNWWEEYYGPAPYTSGNKLLWDDLAAGIIRQGDRAGIDPNYIRPGLTTIIPVDENGNLLPPAGVMTSDYNAYRMSASWAVGQMGPAEYAWRSSSDFPYAAQFALAMAKPGRYFGTAIDTYNYSQYNATWDAESARGQYINVVSKRHLTQEDVIFNGQTTNDIVNRGSGYLNWIADYLTNQGVSPSVKLPALIKNYQVNLAYKLAGFSDQKYLTIMAEQVSPGSTNDTIVIPTENYKIHLNKSTPVAKLVYSAVIIEKTSNGFSVRGYNVNDPFFTVIPSQLNNQFYALRVLNKTAKVYKDYQNLRLVVPYGYEFSSHQEVVDFLVSYERFLIAQGWTFEEMDEGLGKIKNWKLSSEEFLYWMQQGWTVGSILVVSPVSNVINAITVGAIADGITDSQYASRVIDQNFKLVKNVDYEVMRNATNLKINLTDPASVVGFVEVDLVQYEHVLIFDNATVFNDIIYTPETGNRQYRLKLVGQKTATWDGSLYAPGFIYTSGKVDLWVQGKDYLQGDIVSHKSVYYTALQNVIASNDFQYIYWKEVPNGSIQEGLLPNFSTVSAENKAYYNSYPSINNKKQMDFSHGLIGYRPRQYLADLGLTETSQIEFYKGYIKQKGSLNAINQLVDTEFNNLTSDIDIYEEWAFRLGTYGAIDTSPFLEIVLDEKSYGVNPALAEFVGPEDTNRSDGVTIFNRESLYKSSGNFNGNIALLRDENTIQDSDILTAGYVNINDVNTTLFDIADYSQLNSQLSAIGTGYLIWVAKSFTQDWNVYRVTETINPAVSISSEFVGFINIRFRFPHTLTDNEVFIIKAFSDEFDAVYQVAEILDLNTVSVRYTGGNEPDEPIIGNGAFYKLVSVRYLYMEDNRIYGQPPNGWKVGDRIWIDDDAETTAVQGQPYGTQPNGTWKVYEKTMPWGLKQSLKKSTNEYAPNDGFGTSVRMSADGLVIVAGSPNSGNGIVNTFLKTYTGEFSKASAISSNAENTASYGAAVDLSLDNNSNSILAVGAPQSLGNAGYVMIYDKSISSTNYSIKQLLIGTPDDIFGSSMAFNQDGKWLYVGAPGNDKVYLYGLNPFIPVRQEVVSVQNDNTINFVKLSSEVIIKFRGNTSGPSDTWEGNITATVGDVLSQDLGSGYYANATVITGNTVQRQAAAGSFTANILSLVYSTSNVFLLGNTTHATANVSVNGTYANVYPTYTENIITSFTANTVFVDPVTNAITKINNSLSLASGANATVSVNTVTNIIPLTSPSGALANITLNNNIVANTGSYISQVSSGANIRVYKTVIGSNRVYGYYQPGSNIFVTGANISISGVEVVLSTATGNVLNPWANVGVKPTTVSYNNLFVNNVATGIFANVVTSIPTANSIQTGWEREIEDVNSLLITTGTKTYIPTVDYTLDPTNRRRILFSNIIPQSTLVVKQQPYYALVGNVSGNVGSNFGYALSSSYDGAQLAVGAPNDTVYVDDTPFIGAGAVYVYDRVIEAFNSTGSKDYLTTHEILPVHRVTIDNIDVTGYTVNTTVTSNDTIRFIDPPPIGKVVYVETNKFTLLERLIGIDSLEGGTDAIQANAFFGTSLTICSNNCAIYIGAPNYSTEALYNTGAVWKFHNKGRLYGINTGYRDNPVFTPGDSIRLDNYPVTVSARMMPTANGNILTLSSSVRANVGEVISQNLGSGYYANVTVLVDTSADGNQSIIVTDYTTANTFNYGQSIPGANVISVGGSTTSAYPMVSLDSLIKDINDANLLGITAVNENNRILLRSDSTVAKNLLRILSGTNQPGSQGVLASADLIVFAFMQIIINPYGASNEYFGSKVKLASNAYMLIIGSDKGTTRAPSTYDQDTTVFDDNSTRNNDQIQRSGSVYVYELYDDPRNEVEHPGRYAFAQQLNTGELNPGDRFGYALDIEAGVITVSAPGDDTEAINGGSVYVFDNPLGDRGWKLIRYQDDKVDLDSLTRLYLYSNTTNRIIENLQFIDPAKGRILGQAEQEITFKTDYDPAVYNKGSNPAANINTGYYWTDNQIGQVWWNLGQVRFIEYEQDTLVYRSANWGQLFPGSVIEVCEWVESDWLPSQYAAQGGNGVPKYADNSAYVQVAFVDPVTGIISSKYYYWVKDKTEVDPNNPSRNIPTTTVADIIANPKNQGIPYAAVIRSNAMILFNIGEYLSGENTILHLDYQRQNNNNIIHSEYELVQRGNSVDEIPENIVNRLIDSLSGINDQGDQVPDPKLSVADRYGIDVRPRQSMFLDRTAAMRNLVSYINAVLIEKPVARQYSLNNLFAEEPVYSSMYDQTVPTDIELAYIDVVPLDAGWRVLVEQNTTQDNLWTIHTLGQDKTWNITRVQSYKTSLYWNYVNWFAKKADGTRYSLVDKLDFVVPTLVDAKKLLVSSGQEILVRVSTGTIEGGWILYVVNELNELNVVGIENGTIQLNTNLGDFANNELGFGNQAYSSNRYDQNPDIEIRKIVQAIKDDIFVGELQGEFNKTFFVMLNYLLSEQKFVDWVFKTSFVSATHNLRTLSQFPSFVQDNQTYYQDYINEVKPYRTKLREYTLKYTGNDTYPSTVTDFDLPPYYDQSAKIFRSPSGEVESDSVIWQTYPYNQWFNDRKYSVTEILIAESGAGYTLPPTVTIVADTGGGSGATATAFIDGDTGSVTRIEVTNSGSGYVTTPQVIINGNGSTTATAYAIIKNNQVRTFDTAIKFDRVNYTSSVEEWQPNTQYYVTQWWPASHVGNGYVVGGNVVTHLGADGIRTAYYITANLISGNTFVTDNYAVYGSSNIKTANDRILGYYQPTVQMPARDLQQLIYGIEYPGVQIQGPAYNIQPFYAAETTAKMTLSNPSNVSISVGNVIVQSVPVLVDGNIRYSTARLTVTNVYSSTLIEGVINSDGFVTGNIQANISTVLQPNGIWIGNLAITNAYPTDIIVKRSGPSPFDIASYDNISYDSEGNPTLGDDYIDTIIRSNYRDTALGTRAEDINVDGGAYIDRYSSHAPEELVPGITFDTLDMKVYTLLPIDPETNIMLGYRIFENMLGQSQFLRISEDYITTLSQPLQRTDTEMHVADASKLPVPNPSKGIPGVVFIGAERIVYYSLDLENNIIGRMRRGTAGTACYEVHPAGQEVIDASGAQLVPNSDVTTIEIDESQTYTVTTTPSYHIQLSADITANVGDYITQSISGANATIVGTNAVTDTVLVTFNSAKRFEFANAIIITNANITANVGDYITQSSTGANLEVLTVTGGTNVTVRYTSVEKLDVGYNTNLSLTINGEHINEYPISIEYVVSTPTQLALVRNNVQIITGNTIVSSGGQSVTEFAPYVYPLSFELAGLIEPNGTYQVEVTDANVTLRQTTMWYQSGNTTITNGDGFDGTNTVQVDFLREHPASFTDRPPALSSVLVTEGAVNNRIITEDGKNQLIEES